MEECFTIRTMLLHSVKLGALKLKKISRINRAMKVLAFRSSMPMELPPAFFFCTVLLIMLRSLQFLRLYRCAGWLRMR